jgi:DNA-directed RNA polymerase subunit M/transcription elongation factor TFIIS
MQFCAYCKGVVLLTGCRCGRTQATTSQSKPVPIPAEPGKSFTDIPAGVWSKGLPRVEAYQPTTDRRCPRCGNPKAYFRMRQTRRADEPTTVFYTCTKCGAVRKG